MMCSLLLVLTESLKAAELDRTERQVLLSIQVLIKIQTLSFDISNVC